MHWQDEDAFRAAVTEATKQATQEVAARNRRRLRIESLLIGAAVSAAIAIPTTLVLSGSAHRAERNNAHTNCKLITELAGLGDEAVKAEREQTARFEHESHDRLGLTPQRFDQLIKTQQARQAHKAEVAHRVASHSCG